MGIFENGPASYDREDLNAFFSTFAPQIPKDTQPLLQSVDGGVAPTTNITLADSESDLDFEVAYPILWPQQTVLYEVDERILCNAVSVVDELTSGSGSSFSGIIFQQLPRRSRWSKYQ